MDRTEKQKMLAGELYSPTDPQLLAERRRCEALLRTFNAEPDESRRMEILGSFLGSVGPNAVVMPPFACDYGYNLSLGPQAFINYGGVILDCAPVSIGESSQVGPGVQLLAWDHPREPELRRQDVELAFPITVGANVWIGAGAIVCAGVSIGDDSIIGAGSVVTKDVPSGVVAVGVPTRVVRSL
jgi:maltose O-acetyltransferase